MAKPKLLSSLIVKVTEDDQKLMEWVKEGDQVAFKKLFEKYKDPLYSFILRMVHNDSVAQELAQETLMRVFKNANSYQPTHKFSTWMYTIAKNLCLDYLKKKKEINLNHSTDDDNNVRSIEDFAGSDIEIDLQLIDKDQKEIVKKCIDNLAPKQKEALLLRVFSENSYAEIADMIDKTEKSVKSLINRAKTALSECVKNCMEQQA